MPYISCLSRHRDIKLTPEEAVRQLYLYKLMHEYNYPESRIEVEYPIHFGREVKRADIVIMDKDRPTVPYMIVELKKPKLTDGKEQLKSYCNAAGAPICIWTNGEQISCYNRKDPNYFEAITNIPKASEKLSDIINEQFTYNDLENIDIISRQKRSLSALIQEIEDEVLANAGVDSFEENSKFITSGALLHLTVKAPDEILPDYLTLVLNSPVVQMQAERDTNGAIIRHWKPSDIEKVIIPVLDIDTQKEIAAMVQDSFALRRGSLRKL